jgi:hypothetical protein
MKKHLTLILAVAMILGVALAVLAQQTEERRQRFQRYREAQQQAIDAIQAHAAKLKASMEESAQAMQNRPQWQDMSEEQRNQLRETFRKRREEQQKIVADLDLQVARLKGPRQLRTEHEEVVEELRAILDVAGQEKAKKTAGLLEKLIGKHQTKYEDTLKKLGFEQ